MLLEVVSLLSGICVLLAGGCVWLFMQLRKQGRELAELKGELEKQLVGIKRGVQIYQAGCVGLGEQIAELQAQLEPLAERLTQVEQRDPGTVTFTQAARLADMGASADDLARTCGISQGEAQLLSRLHQARRPPE